jgi:hypothetical protein
VSARRAAALFARIAAVCALAGCETVAAWERDRLAQPHMAAEPESAQRTYRDHVHRSREAGDAGSVGEGGGCGCY